jgi:hypothetical protein
MPDQASLDVRQRSAKSGGGDIKEHLTEPRL